MLGLSSLVLTADLHEIDVAPAERREMIYGLHAHVVELVVRLVALVASDTASSRVRLSPVAS